MRRLNTKLKFIFLFTLAVLLCLPAVSSVRIFDSSDTELGNFVDVKCSSNLSCAHVSGKLVVDIDNVDGVLQTQVAATATTITAAQCGSTFINSGVIEMELPEASTVLGCRLTFIVGAAAALTIDPDAADQILLLTDAAGDSLVADAAGESLVLEAISATQWAPVGAEKGIWTDSN